MQFLKQRQVKRTINSGPYSQRRSDVRRHQAIPHLYFLITKIVVYIIVHYFICIIFSHVTKLYYGTSKLPVRRPISSNIRNFFINSFIVRDISQYFVDATVQVRFNAQHAKNKPIVITESTAENDCKYMLSAR